MSPRKLPPFSLRKSWRETLAFVAGLLVMVGAFGPWFRARLVESPPLSAPTAEPVVLHAALGTAWTVALAAAFGLALGLSPLPRVWKASVRAALFGVAFAAAAASLLLGPNGFPFAWGGVFQEYEGLRPAWGFVLTAGGSLAAAGLLLSRLLDAAHAPDEASASRA
jgi:hypothetical protein